MRTSGDVLAGLLAAQESLENHDYVPRAVAEWLAKGIALYLSGRHRSLDAALGLNKGGAAQPLRKHREERALKGKLAEMFHLHLLGATIPQAATLVASVNPGDSVNTLEDRYRRGGYTANVKQLRALHPEPMDPTEALAGFPDYPLEVAQAKASILAMYAKRSA
jgi:hypothetical protein